MALNAYIVEAVRTPGGRRNGKLSKFHPADLGALVINELVDRTKMDPAAVDDVIFGCVSQIGSQSANIARTAVLSSKLPITVPGTTVDRQCGSSQQAIHFAAQAVMSGTQDVVIAGGVEIMSLVPIGSAVTDGMSAGRGNPFDGQGVQAKWPGVMFSQFEGAELVAEKWNVQRAEMEKAAVESHRRAHEATKGGKFKQEIVAVPLPGGGQLTEDEGIRWPASAEKMAQLPLLKPDGGRLTAATASQITDGAAAVLICNERGLQKLKLRPRARIVQMAVVGSDPVMMLAGPIPATEAVLKKANLSINDIAIYEVNEAFASVPLAWARALKADLNKLNVNGGAMALGHPLGATGAKLMTTLLNELERRGARYGLQAICEGGGTANATIIERIPPTGGASASSSSAASSPAAAAPSSGGGSRVEQIFGALAAKVKSDPSLVQKVNGVYHFKLAAAGGAVQSWTVDLKSPPGAVRQGAPAAQDCTISMAENDFVDLLTGKLNGQQAFMQGKLKIAGNMGLAMKLNLLSAQQSKM